MEAQKIPNSQSTLKKKDDGRIKKKKLTVLQIILQGSLLYYRSIITKLHGAGPSAHGGQWNRVGAEKRPQ